MTTTQELLGSFPEINPANYGDDDVNALNAWGIAAHTAIESLSAEVERQRVKLVNQSDWLVEWRKWEAEAKQLRAQLEAVWSGEQLHALHEGVCAIRQLIREGYWAEQSESIAATLDNVLATHPAPAAPVVEQDRIAEVLRQALNKLPRYSFHLGYSNNVKCVPERTGKWIEWQQAHELFDPVAVDAALHPTQTKGEKA